jgi:high-affinity iron transporter
MLAASVIVFREVLEAVLVIGIVLAATKEVIGSRRMVGIGVLCGVAGAFMMAMFADVLSSQFEGTGQDVFNACAMILAVSMLAWHNIWMTKHGRELAANMSDIGCGVADGSKHIRILGIVVAIAVLREGGETVLFLWGIATSGQNTLIEMIEGVSIGIGCGILLGAGIYFGLLRIPHRHLFRVTSWLITLLAAGMAAQAVTFLAAAGLINVVDTPVWDSSGILSEESIFGRMMHTLTGYMDRPNSVQLLAWAATILVITYSTKLIKSSEQAQ